MELPAYTLTRKRMKNMRIRVTAPHGEVLVSAPHHVSKKAIDQFVVSRASWIAAAQLRAQAAPTPLTTGPEADAARARLRELLPPLIAYWSLAMGADEPTWTIRRMTTRWGSCNAERKHINIALELGRKDEELLEYVVVHEIAHLFVQNHGPQFTALMNQYLPEWRSLRARLNGR